LRLARVFGEYERAMSLLTEREKMVQHLFCMEMLSVDEIAARLDITPKEVRAAMLSARDALKSGE